MPPVALMDTPASLVQNLPPSESSSFHTIDVVLHQSFFDVLIQSYQGVHLFLYSQLSLRLILGILVHHTMERRRSAFALPRVVSLAKRELLRTLQIRRNILLFLRLSIRLQQPGLN